MTVLSIAAIATLDSYTPLTEQLVRSTGETVLFSAMLSNIILNLFATSNIVVRLLCYRGQILASFGSGTQSHILANEQLKTMGILLESAAINIPTTIFSAIVLWRVEPPLAEVALQVAVPFQV